MKDLASLISVLVLNIIGLLSIMLIIVAIQANLKGNDWFFVFEKFIPTIINF